MKLADRIRARLAREKFLPTRLGVLIHPFYIIRSRLARAIAGPAGALTGKVLDFGCGSKPYEMLFANAASYEGVDMAATGHSHRTSRIDHFYDGDSLPFDQASFDHIVSFEVFEHVFNIDRILAELQRVLRPGGTLLVSIPFAWDEHEQPYDFARYTSFGIREIVERHGFELMTSVKTTTDIEAIAQLFAAYLHQHVSPKRGVLRAVFQLVVIAPVTLLGLAFSAILPNSGQLFSNLVVTARRF